MTQSSGAAEFIARAHCVACRSTNFRMIAAGRFSDEPVRGFIDRDPWGINPLPFLRDHPWELVQCRDCSLMFHKWLLTQPWQEIRFTQWMSESAIRRFEREHNLDTPRADFEKGVANVGHVLRIEAITKSLRGDDRLRLLDFGCGWGDFLTIANQFGLASFGIDRAADRQRVSRARGIEVLPDLRSAREVAGKPFHAVTLFQVLEHVEEPMELLQSIREVMEPHAVLVLEVPDCAGITGIVSQSDYYTVHPLEHINCFTPSSLERFAGQAGFERIDRPLAHVTTSPVRVAKTTAKHLIGRDTAGTNLYFRRK